MNKTGFEFPRDSYAGQAHAAFARIDPAARSEEPRETATETWWCRTQALRGPVLEKAGCSLLHIAAGRIYDRPGRLKMFEAIAYPADPRRPGLVCLANLNQTEGQGELVVLYADLFFQHGQRDEGAAADFAAAIEPVYARHGRDFGARYKAQPGRIMAGLGAEAGVMEFFPNGDVAAFVDDLIEAALGAWQGILNAPAAAEPAPADYAALYRHRARLVEWLTLEDIGIRFARASGVPLEVIEAYGYPPLVRY